MAHFSVNTDRFDPYKNFKFRIQVEGRTEPRRRHQQGQRAQAHHEVVKHREAEHLVPA